MSPLTICHTTRQSYNRLSLRSVAKPPPSSYNPGAGSVDPRNVNNHAFFALFAIVGVALVLGSIWFFFWARNGGFRWRGRRDWEDYKSTVLRRKGPNGTTLSGATKTTALGGGSIVVEDSEKGFQRGGQGRKVKVPRGNRNNDDKDVRAYRHEKPARVGGLNREADGITNQDFAYPDNTYSDSVSQLRGVHVPINTPRAKNKPAKKANPATPSPRKKSDFYQTPQSNASSDSHRPLRPNAQSPGGASTPSRSRQHSPMKGHARNSVPGSFYTEPLDFDSRYSTSNSDAGVTEDSRGTKAYFHPIPGLGSEAKDNTGARGFRRGQGRRDSLSDSEGETNVS